PGVMRSGPLHRTGTPIVRKCHVAPAGIFVSVGGGMPGKLSYGARVSYRVPSGLSTTNHVLSTQRETVTGRLDRLWSVKRTVTLWPTCTCAWTEAMQLTRP